MVSPRSRLRLVALILLMSVYCPHGCVLKVLYIMTLESRKRVDRPGGIRTLHARLCWTFISRSRRLCTLHMRVMLLYTPLSALPHVHRVLTSTVTVLPSPQLTIVRGPGRLFLLCMAGIISLAVLSPMAVEEFLKSSAVDSGAGAESVAAGLGVGGLGFKGLLGQ